MRKERFGLAVESVSRGLSETLAAIARRTLDLIGQTALITAGGDTSASVCRELGVRGDGRMEGDPTRATLLYLPDRASLRVLKSGSFASADFLRWALDHLRREGEK